MKLFSFDHGQDIKPGCYGWRCSVTYWLAESREQAEQDVAEETPGREEPHGVCANCLADLLASGPYAMHRSDGQDEARPGS